MKTQIVHVNFCLQILYQNMVQIQSQIIMLNIQSFPQNYQQLALPHVLISLELHANTVMKLNLPYQSYF